MPFSYTKSVAMEQEYLAAHTSDTPYWACYI